MSTFYGRASTRVSSADVNAVYTTGGSIITQIDDTNGEFYFRFQHTASGCGAADTGFFIELKDTSPNWTWISCRIQLIGSAACWSFSNSSAYGAGVGNSGTANLQNYDPTYGDSFTRSYLSVNESPYDTHSKVYACDNDSNNFMRYNTGVYRGFTMVRRRNMNGNLAGIHHGRSCNSTGSGSDTIVDQIRIWN
jgi:hypothetical protein